MKEWEAELDQQSELLKKTAQGKTALATFLQTKRYLQPFYKMLQGRVCRNAGALVVCEG